MKRLSLFLLTILVVLSSGCSGNRTVACVDKQCASAKCDDEQLLKSKDGMLDFCQAPAFGTFALEKDGITWHFGESVSYGQFVNGDYWVLDKGEGVKITKVTPGPQDGHNGSMVNPTVGTQAYDKDITPYDASKGVTFPVVLKAGDSLVSTVSIAKSDLNQYGKIDPSWYSYGKGLTNYHAKLKHASVLTVVSEVPEFGSFRPTYIGNNKKIYNISDIDDGLLPNYKAPATLPDVSYYERGVERPWLMHLYHYQSRRMHPVENMPNYHREVGNFLSDLALILLTDAKTEKLLYGFIQTGIDHYYTITSGKADNSTFEFHSILTGLLLSDEEIARVWVDGKSQTVGRATEKFYFPDGKLSPYESSIVKDGESWRGHKVMFRKKLAKREHEHLHPSEWHMAVNSDRMKHELYRICCDSKPHFGMVMASRALKAEKYWPNQALSKYLDRWVWESKNGIGADIIKQYWPKFPYSDDERKYLVGSKFVDSMYLTLGFNPNGVGPLSQTITETGAPTTDTSTTDTSTTDTSTTDTSITNTSTRDTSTADTSTADTSRTDTSRTDTSTTDTSTTDTSRTDTSTTDTSTTGTSTTDTSTTGTSTTGTSTTGTSTTGTSTTGTSTTGTSTTGTSRTDPSRTDPSRKDPSRKDPSRKDPSRKDPSRTDGSTVENTADTTLNKIEDTRVLPRVIER